MIKLAIDAMGGDYAPDITVKGAMQAIKEFPDLELVLYGDRERIMPLLTDSTRITVQQAPRQIQMGEKDPITEIRNNRDTSMVTAFEAVKNREVSGVVTAGPTQGAIVAAHLIIRRIKGMKRVALCPNIPTLKEGGAIMLDVGANIEIRPEHIVQYAEFAHIYSQAVRGIENPTCALLNIGTEPGKGRELEKETYQLLSENKLLNFKGNIEPKELLTSDIDIIITDGFTGNIAMKTFEGAAKAFGLALKDEIQKTFAGKLGYLFMRKNLSNFKQRFSADEIGGAAIFGVDGVVIKAHGSSSAYAFKNAIRQARLAVLGDVVNKMKERIQDSPISE